MTDTPTILAQSPGVLVAEFPGSEPKPYVTTFAEGKVLACTCKGWHFRGDCKHAKALQLMGEVSE